MPLFPPNSTAFENGYMHRIDIWSISDKSTQTPRRQHKCISIYSEWPYHLGLTTRLIDCRKLYDVHTRFVVSSTHKLIIIYLCEQICRYPIFCDDSRFVRLLIIRCMWYVLYSRVHGVRNMHDMIFQYNMHFVYVLQECGCAYICKYYVDLRSGTIQWVGIFNQLID